MQRAADLKSQIHTSMLKSNKPGLTVAMDGLSPPLPPAMPPANPPPNVAESNSGVAAAAWQAVQGKESRNAAAPNSPLGPRTADPAKPSDPAVPPGAGGLSPRPLGELDLNSHPKCRPQ